MPRLRLVALVALFAFPAQSQTLREGFPHFNKSIYAIQPAGDRVFVAGQFTRVGPTTGSAVPLAYGTGQPIALPQVDGTVYSIVGQPRNRVAALDTGGGVPTAFDANANSQVSTILARDGKVYVGGDFSTMGGVTRNRIAAVEAGSGALLPWNPGAGSSVFALALDEHGLFAAGFFSQLGGVTRRFAGVVDTTSGVTGPWNPNPNTAVRALAVSGNDIYLGGDFATASGVPRLGFAAYQFVPLGVPSLAVPSIALAAAPNPSLGRTRFSFTLPRAGSVTLRVFDVQGRLVAEPLRAERPAGPQTLEWNGHAAPGVYFARLEAPGLHATKRIVLL